MEAVLLCSRQKYTDNGRVHDELVSQGTDSVLPVVLSGLQIYPEVPCSHHNRDLCGVRHTGFFGRMDPGMVCKHSGFSGRPCVRRIF